MKKNILITGSTDGIGKLTAVKLAKEGHQIYLHGRNSEKLAAAVSEIKEISGNDNIGSFTADFADLDSVNKMADKINEELLKLDVLINNAGVFKSPVSRNKDGYDLRFTVNYFAPYLLTKKIIPLLNKGEDSRIINLSSAAQSRVSFEAMTGNKDVQVSEGYAQSKLALTMWSFNLADEQKEISVIAVNPGSLLNTKMANEAYGQSWSPAEKGVDILYALAVSDEHKGITGKYFDNDRGSYGKAHPDAYNREVVKKLLEQTEKLIKRS